jgi:hypothetical protein
MTIGQGKGPFRFKNTGRKQKFTEKSGYRQFFAQKMKRNACRTVIPVENER